MRFIGREEEYLAQRSQGTQGEVRIIKHGNDVLFYLYQELNKMKK